MPNKRDRVNLSFIPGRLKRVRDFGREHRMHANNGSLQDASVCMQMIVFLLDLRADGDVDKYLREKGSTLHDFILRSVKEFMEEES